MHIMMKYLGNHYTDVTMGAMASQVTSVPIVYSTVGPGAEQRIHQSSASLAFVWGIHRWPVNSPHKRPAENVSIWWRHLDLLLEHVAIVCQIYVPTWDILQGSSRLRDWLSLWRWVPWINHLPPVCWYTYWKLGAREHTCLMRLQYQRWWMLRVFHYIYISV